MNGKHQAYLSAIFLFACLCSRNAHSQTLQDYAVNEPFRNVEDNFPASGGSTVAPMSTSGPGAIYQPFYHRSFTDIETGKSIKWGGALHALFLDEAGRFREDNGIKGKLEDTNIDYVVEIFSDESSTPARTRVRRFVQVGSSNDATLNAVGTADELDTLNPIWNARNVLADIPQENLLEQRLVDASSGRFDEDAGNKRYIFTYVDVPGQTSSGKVDTGEVIDFVPDMFDPGINSNWRYLGLIDREEAMEIVRYVRGEDIPGWRSRIVDLPGDASAEEKTWLLGDIVNSSPHGVNAPQERYDFEYGDTTYKTFKDQYVNRRQMIYVGANDGMLHAFNGGVWDPGNHSLDALGHKLGAEMWAYVPMNLLPHLQWLKAPDYSHVYYVDGSPQAFDVNIFPDDAIHPGGWGTILVVGMGFGGGDFPLDLDDDGVTETTRTSAVIVMDVTDPERPPVLLAELTAPGLDFTTAAPAVIKARRPDDAGDYNAAVMNQWLLVLGSGPEDAATATSTSHRPTLVAWNLQTRDYVQIPAGLQASITDPAGFYGNLAVVDYDNDYVDDAVYVGTVEGTEQVPGGRLKKLSLNPAAPAFGFMDGTAQLSTLVDVALPVVAKPAFIHSYANGTSRDYASVTEQRLFGIKDTDNLVNATLDDDSFVNATDIIVQADAATGSTRVWESAANNSLIIEGASVDSFADLLAVMDNKNGWFRNLRADLANPAERVVNPALMLRSSAIFTSYLPEAPPGAQGESFIHALHFRTGTADQAGLLGMDNTGVLQDAVSAGAIELATASLNITKLDAPNPGDIADNSQTMDAGSDTFTLVGGTVAGSLENIDLVLPPPVMTRLSWELLDTSFTDK